MKNKITKSIKKENVILFIMLLFTTSMFYYLDINSNIRQGMNFWEALFSGRFFQYYSLNLESKEAGLMCHEANYDMIMNFFMGVWQLPLYIIEKIVGGNILNFLPARIWGKLYLIVAVFLSGNVLKRLARMVGIQEEQLDNVSFMFMSGVITMLSICIVGQADILAVLFSLLAYEQLFTEDGIKPNWMFILYFTLAVACKNFALFIFIPVILYRYKNLIKIAIYSCTPLAISMLVGMPFKLADPVGNAAKKPRLWNMLFEMMANKINLFGVDVPLLLIGFATICIVAFVLKYSNGIEGIRNSLLLGYISIFLLFVSMYTFPYWLLYLTPFTTLFFFMVIIDKESIYKYWILECAATFSIFVGFMISFNFIFSYEYLNVYDLSSVGPVALTGISGAASALGADGRKWLLQSLAEFVDKDIHCNIWSITYAIYAVWAVVMAVVVGMGKKVVAADNKEEKLVGKRSVEESCKNSRTLNKLLIIRVIAAFLICNIGVIIYCFNK